MSQILPYEGTLPEIPETAFLADGARIVGRVRLGEKSSIWFNAVLRGDLDRVVVGPESNVQDGAVVHVDIGFPCTIGDRVTVGHRAVLHGCEVSDGAVVGMGAIVLNGAKVGREAFIAAGALVREGQEIPERALVVGVPGKVVRILADEEEILRRMREGVQDYVRRAEIYRNRKPSA
jgi:carbonic anhydrase/acetyltransferase-like protein (isoleucine patch superfamily)